MEEKSREGEVRVACRPQLALRGMKKNGDTANADGVHNSRPSEVVAGWLQTEDRTTIKLDHGPRIVAVRPAAGCELLVSWSAGWARVARRLRVRILLKKLARVDVLAEACTSPTQTRARRPKLGAPCAKAKCGHLGVPACAKGSGDAHGPRTRTRSRFNTCVAQPRDGEHATTAGKVLIPAQQNARLAAHDAQHVWRRAGGRVPD